MIALILLTLLSVGTLDNDGVLEFFWDAACGNVHHYNVYTSVDDGAFILDGSTESLPTADNPYVLKTSVPIGSKVVVKVQAADADGNTGLMSVESDPVWSTSPPGGNLRGPRSE